jgi:NADPH:quinone reductase-like Zn-dependent oxidoreductase
MDIPSSGKAVALSAYEPNFDNLTVEDRPIAALEAHDVMVQIAASPINPSDVMFIYGRYGVRKPLPAIPGFEASGRVIAAGEKAGYLLGQRVACFAPEQEGTWMQYLTTNSLNCFPVGDEISDEQAAMMLVNPLTAWALMDIARESGVKTVVQTAAASALGKMIVRLGEQFGIETVNIVRRDGQIADLQAAGARYILNSSEPTFEKHLRELCRSLEVQLAFDAVGGELTGQVVRAMPNRARMIVYGGLSEAPVEIGVDQLIFKAKQISGFWLSYWMRDAGLEKVVQAWMEVQAQIGSAFQTNIRARYGLEQVRDALVDYTAHMTDGKVLITP